ncbi:Cell wall alpha-1,3-glucan synthase [Lachnellula willkommii]|uniref:alpha-1,3-glucan synthase n=1 Tax=Lachnellula willkommii TaxID=215461 RepID=A0A559ML81_9HELO|nr:Cell wall alpha-1,3-glucan synthase [Lachnellula willkommii]
MPPYFTFVCFFLFNISAALRFDQEYISHNLNQNETATNPLDYNGSWENHTYHPSPSNWRLPFYTVFLDKYANGDPTNDNANNTVFEHDILQTQLRHGGDAQGIIDSLDYIYGIGIRAIYIAGSPFINQPWGADSYSPLDLTLLDLHYGEIEVLRNMVTEIHKRDMYVIMDSTMATMGDLIAFKGYLNSSTPFLLNEHEVQWRNPERQYLDFHFGNDYNETCDYPRFWLDNGYRVSDAVTSGMKGCYNSEFDQYGDTEAFGVYPDWRRQLSKFASSQDRLREWVPSVRTKISHFTCLVILMLDIDGFRLDKATQITVDALGDFSESLRECARSVGKENFFIPGEITGGNTFGSIYLGRGRQPDMVLENVTVAVQMTNVSNSSMFIRDIGKNALDSAAFHYSIYRALARFLGMDGSLSAGFDIPVDWVDGWNEMLAYVWSVESRYGSIVLVHVNPDADFCGDVFRWPSIKNGTQRWLLGNFITTLLMPGIPLLLWGEEQAFYVLDNTNSNYVFGRQAMSSALAWEVHGCYSAGSTNYYKWDTIVENATYGCHDPWNSLDHRDGSHPIRNTVKSMYQMRKNFPVLNDGIFLQALSKQTRYIYLPGSSGVGTELGLWSTYRAALPEFQDLSKEGGQGNQSVWLVYQNDNTTIDYQFDCSGNSSQALLAPFEAGTTVKNLFYPYDEYYLANSSTKLYLEDNDGYNGCLQHIEMSAWGFKAFVPKASFVANGPVITKFVPGHDHRLQSTVSPDEAEDVAIEIHFSTEMDCSSLAAGLTFTSSTESGKVATLRNSTVSCSVVKETFVASWVGTIPTFFTFKANVTNVYNGIHTVTVNNATSSNGTATDSRDTFLFRTGQKDNPMIFPRSANYTLSLLHKFDNGSLYVSHKAAGADSWRYTLDWVHYSDWMPYLGGNTSLTPMNWTGTKLQRWEGEHVIVQYFNRASGSSDYFQHGDLDSTQTPRRFPHLWAEGPFNEYGFDSGVDNQFRLEGDSMWKFPFMTEWPAIFQVNGWGMNPDSQPDQSYVYGDADGDNVLDRLPPSSLAEVVVNITTAPSYPYLGWEVVINDATLYFELVPMGDQRIQIFIFVVMWLVPVLTGALAVWAYIRFFYQVKLNQKGISYKVSGLKNLITEFFMLKIGNRIQLGKDSESENAGSMFHEMTAAGNVSAAVLAEETASTNRKTILIATIEYDIEDWNIKVKIGGLGVMAQLMGKALGFQNLIWVVPCVGGIVYPGAEYAESMFITILGGSYEVQVQYHTLRNITYVLLDAPIFRAQTKAEPYPPRMDDLSSAVFYSTWNQCIALATKRFPVDLYHINDYHGAAAPLYLLPATIPVCLSLHNAEFQGLWPLRNSKEFEEVCSVYNLSHDVVRKYVQFGDVFNLLHAGSSYLRIHQKSFGAVGVSKKYGDRAWARYPIFWGLDNIGQLPNPDPSDTAEFNQKLHESEAIQIDEGFENERPVLRRQAQEWAGLNVDPEAELMVFVGRWSMQKGIDLIADVMPAILEEHPHVQLICVGPVIDLYGKFAALKLDVMMKKYPGRVYSKPEFTALPPFIFSGAEFALIPSRDEPFGLVAVEFGRKGALGIGARVGGLGQMPGWWFTVESPMTAHLLHQFRKAIKSALTSHKQTRREMRATSAKQRFPVVEWIKSLRVLQQTSMDISHKENPNGQTKTTKSPMRSSFFPRSGTSTPTRSLFHEKFDKPTNSEAVDKIAALPPPASSPDTSLTVEDLMAGRNRPSSVVIPSRTESLQAPEIQVPTSTPVKHRGDQVSHPYKNSTAASSAVSLSAFTNSDREFELEKVDQDFTDSRGDYYNLFEKNLQKLNGDTSTSSLCIEQYLIKSEKEWYGQYKSAKLGRFTLNITGRPTSSSASSMVFGTHSPAIHSPAIHSPAISDAESYQLDHSQLDLSMRRMVANNEVDEDRWQLGRDYKPPTGLRLVMQLKFFDWPLYSFFMALGQIIATSSYQITLIAGTIGQTPEKLYITASIYLATSLVWWIMYRTMKSIYVLSVPFLFYGSAFFLLGLAPYASDSFQRGWIQNAATGMYAIASSSGSIFFALNFGDEGGSTVKTWVFRACIIQGTQQIYVCVLWAWGSYLTKSISNSIVPNSINTSDKALTAIGVPVALCFWAVAFIMYRGLPNYYRQSPGKVPFFYVSLMRRKIVLWFFVVVIIQNYFLSTLTGRNWAFLWSSNHAKTWEVILLVIFFFIFVWTAILYGFAKLSKSHSWILPLFAIGLGAPRWAQILWSCSNIGAWVPWVGSATGSALASRSLWLWLGVLDAIQGVGFGMILLQTLTRVHIAFTLISAQVIGSVATIVARATAPDKLGPGDQFPDFSRGVYPGVTKAWFWVGLLLQLCVSVGFFRFFRKEQLTKP